MTYRFSARLCAVFASVIAALAIPAAASADTNVSQNWSGYAVHATGLTFHAVSGTWRQPAATCTPGQASFAAFWVGLGGYSETSQALEQIGTEVDCSIGGGQQIYAWYELVPSSSQTIAMTVRAGDLMSAGVSVSASRVTVKLSDLSTHKSFSKTLVARVVDLTSAEWITEAPSECISTTRCVTLPLADYGEARFSSASAQTSGSRTAAISSSLWDATKIVLSSAGPRFVSLGGASVAAGTQSTPSALSSAGSAFATTYSSESSSRSTSGPAGTSTGGSGSSGSGGWWGGGKLIRPAFQR